MRLAVRKEEGSVPGGGFHYLLHPIAMTSDAESEIFRLMGHIIIEVDDGLGGRLLADAGCALRHQVEVACLVDGPTSKRA